MIKEGTYKARPVKASAGASKKKAEPVVTVRFMLTEGPDAGQYINWNGQITERAARWTMRGLRALGWNGKDVRTAPKEIIEAGIELPITITHYIPKDEFGNPDHSKAFATVRSVGVRDMPELDPMSASEASHATRMLLDAEAEETEESNVRASDIPPPGDDDIPF